MNTEIKGDTNVVDYNEITELFKQDAFLTEANNCKTMAEFHALFVRNGIEITEEEYERVKNTKY